MSSHWNSSTFHFPGINTSVTNPIVQRPGTRTSGSNKIAPFPSSTSQFVSPSKPQFVSPSTSSTRFEPQPTFIPISTRAIPPPTPFHDTNRSRGSDVSRQVSRSRHPTKSVLRSKTFVKEKSSNFTPFPVFVPVLRVQDTLKGHRSPSRFDTSRTSFTFNGGNNNYGYNNINSKNNFEGNGNEKNWNSKNNSNSRKFSFHFNSNCSNNQSSKSRGHSETTNRVPVTKESINRVIEVPKSDPNQTKVVNLQAPAFKLSSLPSTRIPVTVDIHHQNHDLVSINSPQQRLFDSSDNLNHNLSLNREPKKKKLKIEEKNFEMKIFSVQNMNQNINNNNNNPNNLLINPSIAMPSTSKLNVGLPNGSAIKIKDYQMLNQLNNRSVDLDTINEELSPTNLINSAINSNPVVTTSKNVFNFGPSSGHRASRVVDFSQTNEIHTISSDIESLEPIEGIKVPKIDRRRSSIVAFERFFKSRIGDRSVSIKKLILELDF